VYRFSNKHSKNDTREIYTYKKLFKMNTLYKIFFLFSIVFITSCTKTDPLSIYAPKAVVEGYLVANQPIDIKVTKEIPFSDSTSTLETLDKLTIKIDMEGQSFNLKNDASGHYKSDHLVQIGKTYTMTFTYNDKSVSASTIIPESPQNYKSSATQYTVPTFTFGSGAPPQFPDPISLTWDNTTNDYYLVVVKNTEASPESIFTNRPGGLVRIFREAPTQTNTQEIRPQSFSYFGNHDVILFHVTGDYASLYNDTGNNSLNLQAPYSNVENGLGIFTGLAADTLQLKVTK
jgi:Domain of unknown function (DUF4249)